MGLKADNFYAYEAWDLAPANIPPRSRLFHLRPIGIGTAHAESCTGYIARLAAEHHISAGSLFTHELAPASKKPYLLPSKSKSIKSVLSTSFYPATPALNGLGSTARDWVEILERLTLQHDLRFLTMLRWRNVLTESSLSRSVRAWCPHCLHDQFQSGGGPIYEHLLWALSTVHVCPVHETTLEYRCRSCDKQLRPLADRSRPGYCSRCDSWLGSANQKKKETKLNLRYELWVANQMGELIAAAPKVEADPPKRKVSEFVPTCINEITNGNVSTFARLVDINKTTVYSWCRIKPIPQTDLLLKVCYRIGLSFVDLLTKNDISHDLELIDHSLSKTQSVRSRLLHKSGEAERALLTALEQDPVPSVQDVARRLGFKAVTPLRLKYPDLCKRLSARSRKYVRHRTTTDFQRALTTALKRNLPPSVQELGQELGYQSDRLLRRACPDLCKMLTAKWRKVPGQRKQRRRARRNHQDLGALEKALQQALKEMVPPPLYEIANRLGYASAQVFRNKFPELCEAIIERRSKPSVDHALREALQEEFPPSLNQIAKRLGYLSGACFRKKFSDLCDAIIARRKEWKSKQLNTIRIALEAILHEAPPPTLEKVSNRLGYKANTSLILYYPTLSRAISAKHAEYCKAKFQGIGQGLREVLREEPPPSLRATAARFGYAPAYLGAKFPKVCQAISKRHAQFRKKESLERKRLARH